MAQWQEELVATFRPANATIDSVVVKTESVLILPSNPDRRRMIIYNAPGNGVLFVAFGAEAGSLHGLYSFTVEDGGVFIGVLSDYTGDISAIREVEGGRVLVTEILT